MVVGLFVLTSDLLVAVVPVFFLILLRALQVDGPARVARNVAPAHAGGPLRPPTRSGLKEASQQVQQVSPRAAEEEEGGGGESQ